MTFIKKTENFTCENCSFSVVGSGYTNHCPKCLWSKHVDVSPGDRLGECMGMMKPVNILKKGREYSITHKCIKCGFEKLNKAVVEDNFDLMIKISAGN